MSTEKNTAVNLGIVKCGHCGGDDLAWAEHRDGWPDYAHCVECEAIVEDDGAVSATPEAVSAYRAAVLGAEGDL